MLLFDIDSGVVWLAGLPQIVCHTGSCGCVSNHTDTDSRGVAVPSSVLHRNLRAATPSTNGFPVSPHVTRSSRRHARLSGLVRRTTVKPLHLFDDLI